MNHLLPRRDAIACAMGALLTAWACGGGNPAGSDLSALPWPTDASFSSALDTIVPDRLVRHRIPGAVIVLVEEGRVGSIRVLWRRGDRAALP